MRDEVTKSASWTADDLESLPTNDPTNPLHRLAADAKQCRVRDEIGDDIIYALSALYAATAGLSTALGYMRNARIDLETGATKATAIRTISGGISKTEAALSRAQGSSNVG